MLKRDPKDDTDPNAPTTFFEIAKAGLVLDEADGRFASQSAVVGSTENVGSIYPRSSVPNADVGVEEPLGDDLHPGPVGEAHEIAASIARLEREREAE
jgi:hypothetical protein